MYVILITPYYPHVNNPSNGIFVHQQAVALQARGHNILVCHYYRDTPFWRGSLANRKITEAAVSTLDGVHVHRIPYYFPAHTLFDRWWSTTLALALKKHLRQVNKSSQPAVVYTQWLLPTAAAYLRIRDVLNLPMVTIARGNDLMALPYRSQSLRAELETVWRKADLILANGNWIFPETKKLSLGERANPVRVVRNVKDLSNFVGIKSGSFSGTFQIVSVAMLAEHKGIDVLIRAIAEIKDRFALHLTILGDGPQRAEYEELYTTLGISDLVTFKGIVKHDEVIKALTNADLFVLPSRRDATPNALIEAMAAGLACVASAVGEVPDLIDNEVHGLLVAPGDSAALARAICQMHDSEMVREMMGMNARKRVKDLYSYEKNVATLENALMSVATYTGKDT